MTGVPRKILHAYQVFNIKINLAVVKLAPHLCLTPAETTIRWQDGACKVGLCFHKEQELTYALKVVQ